MLTISKRDYNMMKNLGIIVAAATAIITVIGYKIIVGTYPFGELDLSQSYYNALLLVKTTLFAVNILVDTRIVCMYMNNRRKS